ncbi:MAG: hypothetical protein AAFO93_09050 [Pseudomonadota bacterium]
MRLIIGLLCLSTPAAALEITLRNSFDMHRPSSLHFDQSLCGLWIVNEGREIAFMDQSGEITRRFETDLFTAKALSTDGDSLLIADGFGGFQRMTKDGVAIGDKFRLKTPVWDVEGVIARPDGSLIMTQDDDARVWAETEDGTTLWSIRGFEMIPPMTEPQGIARDRRTGALYVVDDNEGSNSIFEFAPDGTLVDVVPLSAYGRDAEGIALQADTGTLWVGFDDGSRLAVFDYLPGVRTKAADAQGDACLMF